MGRPPNPVGAPTQYDHALIPMAMWHDRLTEKIDGFRTFEETLAARRVYDAGVSVRGAQKAIEAMRRGIQ